LTPLPEYDLWHNLNFCKNTTKDKHSIIIVVSPLPVFTPEGTKGLPSVPPSLRPSVLFALLRRCLARNIWVATLKVKVPVWPWSKIVSGPWFHYLKSDFKTISQKWSPFWDDVLYARFGSLPWTCPAHYFVIWSRILQLFNRNDHYIEMMCHYLAHLLLLIVRSVCIILHYTK